MHQNVPEKMQNLEKQTKKQILTLSENNLRNCIMKD